MGQGRGRVQGGTTGEGVWEEEGWMDVLDGECAYGVEWGVAGETSSQGRKARDVDSPQSDVVDMRIGGGST